ncbi:MAG: ROK family protein [Verrucomicrobiota bacterium]
MSPSDCTIGVDVGGTKIAAGLVRPQGEVLERRIVPTLPERGGEAVLRDALALAETLLAQARARGLNVGGIGIGVCELVDPHGRVMSEQTVHWRGLPVQERFAALAPAVVEADSRAAAFGEFACGAARSFRSFYYVTVGTGIGGCWMLDGVPFVGATGATGTIASSPTVVLCEDCGTSRAAVLEEVASGPALVARYNRKASASARSAEEVICAAVRGDPDADWVVDTAVESLGAALGFLVNVLDPEALVVGGGLGSSPGGFLDRLVPVIRRQVWSEINRGLPIIRASLAADSGFVGAALLAQRRLECTVGRVARGTLPLT